ncbi:MAG: hypothetical protein ACK4NY_07890 [Spirosomataceae bacterium]
MNLKIIHSRISIEKSCPKFNYKEWFENYFDNEKFDFRQIMKNIL